MVNQWNSQPSEGFDRRYAWNVTLILVCLIILIGYIEAMLTPSLISIADDFKVSYSQVTLVLALYVVGGVAMTPVFGKLGDIFGKKRMLSIALVVYTLSVISTAFSRNFSLLLLSRTFQGVGLAIFPLGSALAREEFPRDMIPKVQAIFGAFFGASFAIGLPIGSFVSNSFGWRYTYYTAIPLVIIAVAVAILTIKESKFKRSGASVDYVGALLLSAVLSMFVLFVSEGSTWGWPSVSSLMELASGNIGDSTLTTALIIGVLILVFPLLIYENRHNRKGREPILNFKILTTRNVALTYVIGLIVQFGLFLATVTLTYRLEYPIPAGFGKDILTAGLSVTPFAVGSVFGGILSAVLINRAGAKKMSMLGTLLGAVGFLLEATIPGYTLLWVYSIVCGIGIAMTLGTLTNFVIFSVDPRDMGIATGMQGTFYNVGASMGSPVAAAILTTYTAKYVVGTFQISLASSMAFTYVFVLAAVAFLAAGALVAFSREVITGSRKGMPVKYGSETNE